MFVGGRAILCLGPLAFMEAAGLPITNAADNAGAMECAGHGNRRGVADPESTGRDRRRHERFSLECFAEVVSYHPELLFRGAVRDISLTGCYVETRARLNLKRLAEIELRFSANGHQLSSLARVIDVRPGKGIGVEFLPGDPGMNKRFRDLIEELKARSQVHAERELRMHAEHGF